MAIEKKQEYSQIGLTKKRSSQTTTDDELICTLVPPMTCESSGSTSSTDAVIIIDDDDDVKETTLIEPKKKKPRFAFWWDDDAFNELSCVFKGLQKSKVAASKTVDSFLSLSSVHHDLCEDESYSQGNNKENQDHMGNGHVSLGVSTQDPWIGGCFSCFSFNDLLERSSTSNKDKLCSLVPPTTFKSSGSTSSTDAVIIDDENEITLLDPKKKKPRFVSWWDNDAFNELSCVFKGLPISKVAASKTVDSILSSTTTNLHKTKEDVRSSLSSVHHDNFIDLSEDQSYSNNDLLETTEAKDNEIIAGESSGVNRHVTLEELGVTVEDLKSIPWEAFDPTWEIRSETMDPWLGGYIKDMSL